MLHPSQFEVNEAWIAFRLNSSPIRTKSDGDFNCVALMDAASCFLLGTELIPVSASELTRSQCRSLLRSAQSHKQQLPGQLFIPEEDDAAVLTMEAEGQDIEVVRVPDESLHVFIREAREAFAEKLG